MVYRTLKKPKLWLGIGSLLCEKRATISFRSYISTCLPSTINLIPQKQVHLLTELSLNVQRCSFIIPGRNQIFPETRHASHSSPPGLFIPIRKITSPPAGRWRGQIEQLSLPPSIYNLMDGRTTPGLRRQASKMKWQIPESEPHQV